MNVYDIFSGDGINVTMASSSGTRKRKYISARESEQNIQDFLDSLDTEPYLDHNFIGENDDIDDVQDHDDDI